MATTEVRWCVGGRGWVLNWIPCVSFGQHKPECDNEACRGCLPREAVEGWLCRSCSTQLEAWLNPGQWVKRDGLDLIDPCGQDSLLWAWAWLGINLGVPTSVAVRDDWQRGGESDDLPGAVVTSRESLRQSIEDRVMAHEERLRRDVLGEKLADAPAFEFRDAVALLARHRLRIQSDRDFCADLFAETCEAMIDAHRLCPWRGTATHVRGIPCPSCERKSLWQHGGEDFVRCHSCRAVIQRTRFEIWSEMLEQEVV